MLDIVTTVVALILFSYMQDWIYLEDCEINVSLYSVFILRLMFNCIVGLIAFICLNMTCCDAFSVYMDKNCSERWKMFRIFVISKTFEMIFVPALDLSTFFLASDMISSYSWLVWAFLAGQSVYRIYCTFIVHGYCTRLRRGETLIADYSKNYLEKMRREVKRLKGYRNVNQGEI